jgi:hypothetical protein
VAGRTPDYQFGIGKIVGKNVETVKGLILLYAGRDMDFMAEDGVVKISLPASITFDVVRRSYGAGSSASRPGMLTA